MNKKNLLVICGGQSEEHDISLLSAATVLQNLDPDQYSVRIVGITKDGRWLLAKSAQSIRDGSWEQSDTRAFLLPDASEKALLIRRPDGSVEHWPVDVVIPALHGRFGEDGTIQGLFELAQIPYVGCGVTASAVGMDKLYTKVLVNAIGVTQAPYVAFEKKELEDMEAACRKAEAALSYPMFVKPCDGGSSQGASRVPDRAALPEALRLAARYGTRVMAEKNIFGRELECAVLDTPEGPKASGVGEIRSADEFYSFDAKYTNPASQTDTDPVLPAGKKDEIRDAAVRIFQAVGGKGLSRVDFFLESGTDRVIFNEINTFPGFTAISMYPKLWEAAGLPIPKLLDRLIENALER
ncbi:MAG: D-alanine--D-alanine ligase [Lachnospiraceae bacterium]|nr:D-alanine--D-alanine ligase [Lachnospiraceae bacterium]